MATCCYCGRHTQLVLTGREQHELACGSCGAPLRNLKSMPVTKREKRKDRPGPVPDNVWSTRQRSGKPGKRGKRRKSLSQRIASELFDALDDIFD